jgi:hypothetical protein
MTVLSRPRKSEHAMSPQEIAASEGTSEASVRTSGLLCTARELAEVLDRNTKGDCGMRY